MYWRGRLVCNLVLLSPLVEKKRKQKAGILQQKGRVYNMYIAIWSM